ncbi:MULTISPECIES: hypothetical protein [Brevibacillus]|uniref:hypothetical protein n=1 Tax=Brevibacillus TaxID=55080 RepID=UPI000B181A72|nr:MULTISPECIES: hypothetical protein [Brevibacillus]GEC88617.1 hypothetical protein BBR01nite_09480 [Brevibacillus brevis]
MDAQKESVFRVCRHALTDEQQHLADVLLKRYSESDLQKLAAYFACIAKTRKAEKLALNVVLTQLKYFMDYPPELVIQAAVIHSSKYPDRKENYTQGILRNLAQQEGFKKKNYGQVIVDGGPARVSGSTEGQHRGKYADHYVTGSELPI